MTRGDIAGMTAGDIAGEVTAGKTETVAGGTGAKSGEMLTEKERTQLERRVMEWRKTFVDTFHAPPIFAYFEKNPEAVLEVYDAKTPGAEIGRLFIRGGELAVQRGNNISRIKFGFNDRRYVLKEESAGLLGDFEYKRDIADVEMSRIAETRGFISSGSSSVIEGNEESNRTGFSFLLKSIMGKGEVAYAVHDREKLDSIY